MKIFLNNDNMVVVRAETKDESTSLFNFYHFKPNTQPVPVIRRHKKHKKHRFAKICDICQKVCQGTMGLAVHKSVAHNILSQTPTAVYLRQKRDQKYANDYLAISQAMDNLDKQGHVIPITITK